MTIPLPAIPHIEPPGLPVEMVLPRLKQKSVSGEACWFRSMPVPAASEKRFFAFWHRQKHDFLSRGYRIRKNGPAWELYQWLSGTPGDYTLTPTGAAMLAAAPPTAPASVELPFSAPVLHLDPLPHGLEAKLRDYQVIPSRQLYRALNRGNEEWGYPGAIDLSDMGIGKTYQTLSAALATGRSVGVICPPVGRAGWLDAFAAFGAEPHFLDTYEGIRGGFRPHIAARDSQGRFLWKDAENIILILDEIQSCRHSETLTVECFSEAIRQKIPIIAASATVAVSPLEFRYAGRIIGLHDGGDDWSRFLLSHGCSQKTAAGPFTWDGNLRHLRAIHHRLFPMRGCRVRKEDLGASCPETEISVLPFSIPEAREIEDDWRQGLETIRRLEAQGTSPGRILSMRQKIRMATWVKCETALVPHVGARMQADIAAGYSVAAFMNFNASRIGLSRILNTHAGFYGGMPQKKREYYMREFQADRIHALISNIGSGGASVSLHDVLGWRARKAYIFPTDNVVRMVQATGRVDRVGGQSKSEQFIPCITGSITERMVSGIRRKMAALETLNDGASDAGKF